MICKDFKNTVTFKFTKDFILLIDNLMFENFLLFTYFRNVGQKSESCASKLRCAANFENRLKNYMENVILNPKKSTISEKIIAGQNGSAMRFPELQPGSPDSRKILSFLQVEKENEK